LASTKCRIKRGLRSANATRVYPQDKFQKYADTVMACYVSRGHKDLILGHPKVCEVVIRRVWRVSA
jgi:hypothetical protein